MRVVINPAAGRDIPVLRIVNDAFGPHVEWDVAVTHKSGDALRFAAQALTDGIDVVAVYGGDGTVSEVSTALAGGSVPLAILPGGTGNGVARFLDLPLELGAAAALLNGEFSTRALDLGRVNGRTFVLRADLGFMAGIDQVTSRIAKSHLGKWAYMLSSVRHPGLLKSVHYELTIDGRELEVEAVMILVVNTGAVAFGHKPFVHESTPDDGLLDLLILARKDAIALIEVAGSTFFGNETPMLHWKMREGIIRASPGQQVALDGELSESTPAAVEVVPNALNVIVPKTAGTYATSTTVE